MLRSNSRQTQASPLRFYLQTKQTLTTRNQRSTQRQTNITCFDTLDNFVFPKIIRSILELHHVVKIESRLRVVVGIQFQFFPNRAFHIHFDIHIKIKSTLSLLSQRSPWVSRSTIIDSKRQINATLRLNIHICTTKKTVNQTIFHINFCQWVFSSANSSLSTTRSGKFSEIFFFLLLRDIILIFFNSHIARRSEIFVTHFLRNDILIRRRVILDVLLNNFWIF